MIRPLDRDDPLSLLRKAAVVGTASGVPLHTKLAEPTPVLLINAVEGEPSYTVSTLLMERNARELADGIRRLGEMGFRRTILAVSEWTVEESDALLSRAAEGNFEVTEIAGDFREAGEAGIVREAMRRPAEAGTSGVTVVSLESVYHAQRAMFRNKPMVTKLMQMAGALETASVLEVPVGAYAVDVAQAAGGKEGMLVHLITTDERMVGVRELSPHVREAVEKTTDTLLVIDPEIPGPIDLALESMTPARAIEDISDKIQRVSLQLVPYGGAPQTPVVKAGDRVRRNQIVAISSGGVDAHAPFDGEVAAATQASVDIVRS